MKTKFLSVLAMSVAMAATLASCCSNEGFISSQGGTIETTNAVLSDGAQANVYSFTGINNVTDAYLLPQSSASSQDGVSILYGNGTDLTSCQAGWGNFYTNTENSTVIRSLTFNNVTYVQNINSDDQVDVAAVLSEDITEIFTNVAPSTELVVPSTVQAKSGGTNQYPTSTDNITVPQRFQYISNFTKIIKKVNKKITDDTDASASHQALVAAVNSIDEKISRTENSATAIAASSAASEDVEAKETTSVQYDTQAVSDAKTLGNTNEGIGYPLLISGGGALKVTMSWLCPYIEGVQSSADMDMHIFEPGTTSFDRYSEQLGHIYYSTIYDDYGTQPYSFADGKQDLDNTYGCWIDTEKTAKADELYDQASDKWDQYYDETDETKKAELQAEAEELYNQANALYESAQDKTKPAVENMYWETAKKSDGTFLAGNYELYVMNYDTTPAVEVTFTVYNNGKVVGTVPVTDPVNFTHVATIKMDNDGKVTVTKVEQSAPQAKSAVFSVVNTKAKKHSIEALRNKINNYMK